MVYGNCSYHSSDRGKLRPSGLSTLAWTFSLTKVLSDQKHIHMSYSLNSLRGVYIGDYIGDYYRGY